MVHQAEHSLQERLADSPHDPLKEYLEFLIEVHGVATPVQCELHLERCLQYFISDPRYKNDPRYIDLWLKRAKTPQEFKFMAQNHIGARNPAFYAAYARCLAQHGYLTQARQVCARGEQISLNLIYNDKDLNEFYKSADNQHDLDSQGQPLPGEDLSSVRPSSAEKATMDLSLILSPPSSQCQDPDQGQTELTFVEVLMASRKVKLSPMPRRHDPFKPPEVPTPPQFDYDQPHEWAPQQEAKTQPIKWRSKQSPGSLLNTASSGSVASSQSSLAAPPTMTVPTKLLQVLRFDEQAPVDLTNKQRPFLQLDAIVDASLTSTRQAFTQYILQTLQRMGPAFVLNQYPRKGAASLTKPNLPEDLELTNITVRVRKIIGTGGYGTVFSAVNPATNHRYALKLEKANIPWEWYVVSIARSRLAQERALQSIIHCFYYEGFADEQYMLMPLIGYDSLLSIANYIRTRQLSVNDAEIIAAYFSVELLRTIRALHKNHIVHGDLKAENVMLRAPADKSIHSGHLGRIYSPDGADRWSEYGIVLIDFGRSIDLQLFSPGQQFKATWAIDEDQDCWEMGKGIPWTFQPDYFGIASIAHLLLFGKYLKIRDDPHRRNISEPFKRGMNAELWQRFFVTLLNPQQLPNLDALAALQKMLENWLLNEAVSKLHHLLTDIAYDVRKKRLI